MSNGLKRRWDSVAKHYYSPFHGTTRNFDAVIDHFLAGPLSELNSGGFALDLGGGAGRLKKLLPSKKITVIVGDISRGMLLLSRKHRGGDLFLELSASELPLKDRTLKCVGALLCDSYATLKVFQEVYRVLALGGQFVCALPSKVWGLALRNNLGISLQETVFPSPYGNSTILPSFLYSETELYDLLTKASFEKISVKSCSAYGIIDERDLSPHVVIAANALCQPATHLPIVTIGVASKL